MFMIFFGTVLASNREGGVGFDLHFRSVRCTPPKLRFSPPQNFFPRGRADALRELFRTIGAYPPAVFQNGILTHPILR